MKRIFLLLCFCFLVFSCARKDSDIFLGSYYNTIISPHVQVHTFLAAPENDYVTAHIIELENSLVVLDTMLIQNDAYKVLDFAKNLGKPIKKVIITSEHASHWAEMENFRRYDSYAPFWILNYMSFIPKDFEQSRAENILQYLREMDGKDAHAKKMYYPKNVLLEGKEEIDKTLFEYHILDIKERNYLIITLPEYKVAFVGDFILNEAYFTPMRFQLQDEYLEALKIFAKRDIKYIFVGHGMPGDQSLSKKYYDFLSFVKDARNKHLSKEEFEASLRKNYNSYQKISHNFLIKEQENNK